MKISKVKFERLVTLPGKYENLTVGMTADLEEGDDYQSVYQELVNKVDEEIKRTTETDRLKQEEFWTSENLERCKVRLVELQQEIAQLNQWKDGHEGLIRLFNLAAAEPKQEEVPF